MNEPEHVGRQYDNLFRFISYYYQIQLINELAPESILEIGIGNKTVSNYLKTNGHNVVTCDLNRQIGPDIIGDIREIPTADGAFALVTAFEVLEHIPWDDFQTAVKELSRVTRKNVIISLPWTSLYFELVIRVPFINKYLKIPLIDIFFRLPLAIFRNKSPQHYWEIGTRGVPARKIRSILRQHFIIEKELRPVLNPRHHFFMLKKKNS